MGVGARIRLTVQEQRGRARDRVPAPFERDQLSQRPAAERVPSAADYSNLGSRAKL